METRDGNPRLMSAVFLSLMHGEQNPIEGSIVMRNDRRTRFVAAVEPTESRLMTAVIEMSDASGKFSWFVHQHPDQLVIDGYEVRNGKLCASPKLATLKFREEMSPFSLLRLDDIDFDHPETQNDHDLSMLLPRWTGDVLASMAEVGERRIVKPVSLPHAELLRAMRVLNVRPFFEED